MPTRPEVRRERLRESDPHVKPNPRNKTSWRGGLTDRRALRGSDCYQTLTRKVNSANVALGTKTNGLDNEVNGLLRSARQSKKLDSSRREAPVSRRRAIQRKDTIPYTK